MFKYRIYPSQKQQKRLSRSLNICKQVYNELLDLNIAFYKQKGKGLSKYGCDRLISGKIKDVHSQVLQNVSDRMSKALKNFFRRCKDPSYKRKGFPRFKSAVHSITYPQSGFKFLSEKKLSVSKIGNIPIILHRVPKGKIKTLTIKQNKVNHWFAVFSCELEEQKMVHPNPETKVGIDVGLENFATLSDGTKIENPRFLIKSEKRLKRLHRQFSKKKKGSNNSKKSRRGLAKQYLKVSNQRQDFQHKLSKTLASQSAIISVENLSIANMVKNHHLAKHISDASWYSFKQKLAYKALNCGGQLIEVNPRNTSKTCSGCGTIIEMSLNKRQFDCPNCGLSLNRDHNAAINIAGRVGLTRTYTPADIGPLLPSSEEKASPVEETGTICLNIRDTNSQAGSPPHLWVGGCHQKSFECRRTRTCLPRRR